jgi:putative ABC transport system substrate-binding protein
MGMQMRRREFIALLGGSAVAWPIAAWAQHRGEPRVAILSAFAEADRRPQIDALKQSLAGGGWIEGRNLRIDYRSAQGSSEQLRTFAEELVHLKPNVIFAMATPALVAIHQLTSTIPTVFANVSDPVDGGFVASMARPGGNITGFTSFEYSIGSKWLEALKDVSPQLTRVLVLLNPENYTSRALLRTIETAAPAVNIDAVAGDVREPADIEPVITAFAAQPNGGMIVLPDPATTVPSARIIALALQNRLPTVQTFRYFSAGGGLMSYGPDDVDNYRRAGQYVDRILKGANIAELPVQNPIKYQLVINLKTAKALGLIVPDKLIALADEVIE